MANASAPRRKRTVTTFFIGFVVGLVVGQTVEYLLSEKTLKALEEAQSAWVVSVSAMAPLELATNYWSDVSRLLRPEPSVSPFTCEEEEALYEQQCLIERSPMSGGAAPWIDCDTLSRTLGTPERARACADRAAEIERQKTFKLERGKYLAPATALFVAWDRLTQDGGMSYVYAILQLGLGLLGFMVGYNLWVDRRRFLPNSFIEWIIGVPVGVILAASALAFVLKWLMIGALAGFGQVVSLAGLCAGCTGTVGFCWFCFKQFTAYAASHVLSPRV